MLSQTAGKLPEEVDLIVLGSGAGGLTAALTALLEGLSCLLIEHRNGLGGTSARSSGTVWVPDNRAMRAHGGEGDRDRAAAYLGALVAGRGPREIWERFLDAAPVMQADLEDRAGVRMTPFRTAPDYRQDMPGAAPGWRAMEPEAFDGRQLGDAFAALEPPLRELMLFGGMMVTRAEAQQILSAAGSPRGAVLLLRLVARYLRDRLSWPRGTRLVMGNALSARLLHAVLSRGGIVRRGIEVISLISESGTVTGVSAPEGRVRARRGVMLAGGGFPASATWREKEMPSPTPTHTPASDGCVGRTIELGLEAGGVLGPSLQDNALWFPSSIATRADGSTAVYPHIVLDRAKPGSLVVDRSGRRFVNEAVSYHEFVRAMYRANEEGSSIPAWMICNRGFIWKYGLGIIRPRTPFLGAYTRSGYLKTATSLGDLARILGVPAEDLADEVGRMDRFAETGVDEDFGRGGTIYDRAGGDPDHGPNPCLGPLGGPPYFAVQLEPTPLGSSRGLAADVDGRVLDGDGAPIPGLYVCGNDMQSAFGGEYPGAGAQLGQAMTFGWIAARHAASAMD